MADFKGFYGVFHGGSCPSVAYRSSSRAAKTAALSPCPGTVIVRRNSFKLGRRRFSRGGTRQATSFPVWSGEHAGRVQPA